MNKVETLAELFGGKAMLAMAIDRSAGIVTRMAGRGRVDPKYNATLRAYISGWDDPDMIGRAMDCLEPDVCPTCGQAVPHGAVL